MNRKDLNYLGRANGGTISFFGKDGSSLFFEKIDDGVDRFVGDGEEKLHEHFPIIGKKTLLHRGYFIAATVSVREDGMIRSHFPIADGEGDFIFLEGSYADLMFAVEKMYIHPGHVRCSTSLMPLLNIIRKGQRR